VICAPPSCGVDLMDGLCIGSMGYFDHFIAVISIFLVSLVSSEGLILGVGDIDMQWLLIWSDFLYLLRLKNKLIRTEYCYSCVVSKMTSYCYSCVVSKMTSSGNFWFAYAWYCELHCSM
jgi:hypothetical protein